MNYPNEDDGADECDSHADHEHYDDDCSLFSEDTGHSDHEHIYQSSSSSSSSSISSSSRQQQERGRLAAPPSPPPYVGLQSDEDDSDELSLDSFVQKTIDDFSAASSAEERRQSGELSPTKRTRPSEIVVGNNRRSYTSRGTSVSSVAATTTSASMESSTTPEAEVVLDYVNYLLAETYDSNDITFAPSPTAAVGASRSNQHGISSRSPTVQTPPFSPSPSQSSTSTSSSSTSSAMTTAATTAALHGPRLLRSERLRAAGAATNRTNPYMDFDDTDTDTYTNDDNDNDNAIELTLESSSEGNSSSDATSSTKTEITVMNPVVRPVQLQQPSSKNAKQPPPPPSSSITPIEERHYTSLTPPNSAPNRTTGTLDVSDLTTAVDNDKNDPKRNRYEQLLTLLVVYILPFTYKAGSQLPYVFFLLELTDRFDINLKLAGIFLALTFGCRLVLLAACIRHPRRAAIFGTGLAWLGYVGMIGSASLGNDNSRVASAVVFVLGNIAVGFGEINGALQIFIKELFATQDLDGMKRVGHYLKAQLTVMRVSTVLAYSLGGVLYDFLGILGVATFGCCLLLIQLLGLLCMVKLEKLTGRNLTKEVSHATNAASAARETIARHESQRSLALQSQNPGINAAAIAAAAAAAHGYHGPRSVIPMVSTRNTSDFVDLEIASGSSSTNSSARRYAEARELERSDSFRSLVTGDLFSIAEGASDEEENGFRPEIPFEDEQDEEEERQLRLKRQLSNARRHAERQKQADQTAQRSQEKAPTRSQSFLRSASQFFRIRSTRAISRSPSAIIGGYTGSEDVPISWINYFVAFSVSFQSILNGFVFGTGTLLMFEEYGLSKSVIGLIYSCSAVSGVLASLLPLNTYFVDFVQKRTPSPHNFYIFLFACTYMTMMTAIPNFAAYLVGFLSMNLALGLFVSYLTELQGKISTTENYQRLAPYGQMARRLSGLSIMFITPILYDVMPRLPNIVGACVCLAFTIAVYIGFERAKGQSQRDLTSMLGRDNVHVDRNVVYVRTRPTDPQRRRISFSEQIIMSAVLSSGETLEDYHRWNDDSTLDVQINYARRESMIENNVS